MHASWLRLFYQQDKPVHLAWPGASDETIPLLAEACTQFHARAFTSLFPGRNIVNAIPTMKTSKDVEERAKRVGKHMSWQLMIKDEGYKAGKDALLVGLPLHGSYFTKTYFDGKKNVVENVRPEDLVIPYGVGPRSIDKVERKTQIIWQTLDEAKMLQATQFYSELPQVYDFGEKTKTQDASDKSQGQTEPVKSDLVCILEQHRLWDLDGDGIPEPYIVWLDRQSKKMLRLSTREEEYFTHYVYMPNPEGFYGLGLGHLIAPINKGVNKLIRQAIDSNTLANIGNCSGFISGQMGPRGGDIEIEMGKFRKIDAPIDDIKKGLFQFQFPGPSAATGQILSVLMGRSDRLATVTELTTGQPDKVYQPTMAMALIEQAQQVYTAVYQRVLLAWESELRKYFFLNSKYMPDVEAFVAFNPDGSTDGNAIKRDDYAPDLMVMPVADPKQATKEQRLIKAQTEYQILMQNPLVMQNPVAIYFVTRRILEAMETQDIDQVLPPPMPPREDDPYKENAAALMPQPMIPQAFPDQDHMQHIMTHKELADAKPGQDGYAAELTPEGKKALDDHIQMHVSLMYEAEHGMGQLPQEVPGDMGPPGGMDGGPDLGGIGPIQGTA